MEGTASSQKAAARAYIDALNRWDYEALKGLCSDSPEFNYQIRPASLDGFGKPEGYTKEELVPLMHHWRETVVKKFNYETPLDTVQERDKICLWLRANGKSVDESPYTNECTIIFHFERGTTTILKIVEMRDSLFIHELDQKISQGKE